MLTEKVEMTVVIINPCDSAERWQMGLLTRRKNARTPQDDIWGAVGRGALFSVGAQ